MGEVTSLILDGILCSQCGSFISDEIVGHPQLCDDCDDDEDK